MKDTHKNENIIILIFSILLKSAYFMCSFFVLHSIFTQHFQNGIFFIIFYTVFYTIDKQKGHRKKCPFQNSYNTNFFA